MAEFWDIVDKNGNKTGRIHKKGDEMQDGEFHLSVSVWIKNSEGKYLISKRVSTKVADANMWETTSGSALAGEDGITAALREVREEVGISLNKENGKLFTTYTYPHSKGKGGAYYEVWVFEQDVKVEEVKLQKEETCDFMFATSEQITSLAQKGEFIKFDYLTSLFNE